MAQESSEIQTIQKGKSRSRSWNLGNAFGGWKTTLALQRRQSTRLIQDMVHGFDHVIDGENNALSSTLHWFEKTTHVNRRYLFVGAFLFAASYLSMGRGAGTLCNILGMIYPVYASIKAAENMAGYGKEHWLMYWIVYSTMNFLEIFLEIFLVWLPMYYLLKFLFLSWCMLPGSANGSHAIYGNIIQPLFHQHSNTVDSALSAMTQRLTAEVEVEVEAEIPQQIQSAGADQEVRQRQVNTQQQEDIN